MRRIVMWLLSTVTVVVLLFGYHTSTSGPTGSSSSVVGSTASGSSGTSGSSDTSGSGNATDAVTGSAVDTRWGPVQVRITVAGGRITAVDVVEYPSNNPKDQEINAYALPVLVKETLAAQSADIDMVSGATVTSQGYLESLQSALDQAGL